MTPKTKRVRGYHSPPKRSFCPAFGRSSLLPLASTSESNLTGSSSGSGFRVLGCSDIDLLHVCWKQSALAACRLAGFSNDTDLSTALGDAMVHNFFGYDVSTSCQDSSLDGHQQRRRKHPLKRFAISRQCWRWRSRHLVKKPMHRCSAG